MACLTQNPVDIRCTNKTSTKMIISLSNIAHQFGRSQRTKLFGQQIEFQCKHIGGLRVPLNRSILMDKAFDERLSSLLKQSLEMEQILIFTQNARDICHQ